MKDMRLNIMAEQKQLLGNYLRIKYSMASLSLLLQNLE
jgi:hypothetical protein